MAKRHLRLREPGWRHGLLINGLGAITTAVVTVVIAITKFADGAWAVMVFVPVMIWVLIRLNRQYEREHEMLDVGLPPFDRGSVGRPAALVLVEDLDRKTFHALQYAKTIRSSSTTALHVAHDGEDVRRLERRWAGLGAGIPLEILVLDGDPMSAIARRAAQLAVEADVTLIVPGPARLGRLERIRRGRTGARLTRMLAPNPHVRVTVVRDHPHQEGAGQTRLFPRASHRVVVLVDRPDRAAMQAVSYALELGATEVAAVHAAVEPGLQDELIARWMDLRIPVPLDLVECWDRDVARSVERYVVDLMGPRTEVTVVVPRRDYARPSQRLLHDRTSRSIAKALGRYEHVDIAVVPYFLGRPSTPDRPAPGEAPLVAAR
jgi:hypothetical protein